MSFFIKKKRQNSFKNGEIAVAPKKKFKDEELTSSESEHENNADENESDDEETAQEKRVRLAKQYLKDIEKEESDDSDVSGKLKTDYLKQKGRYKIHVADKYLQPDPDCLKVLRCKEHKIAVTCICVSSDSKFAFSGSKDGGIVKWSIVDGKKLNSIHFKKKNKDASFPLENHCSVTCIAISDDSKYLAVGDRSKNIRIWNPDSLTYINTLKGHKDEIMGLVFRKDSHFLYSCSKDRSVKVWTLDEMSYLETLFGHQDTVMAIDALMQERAVTAGGTDTTVRIWKIAEESQLIFNGTGSIDCIKLINEDNFVSGGDTGELCVWSTQRKKPLCTVKDAHGCNPTNAQPFWINSIAALTNTDLIATGSSDGCLRFWKVSNGCRLVTPLFTIPVTGFVNSLSFSSDGNYLIVGTGQEHRCGRWTTVKEARNGIMIIPLSKSE